VPRANLIERKLAVAGRRARGSSGCDFAAETALGLELARPEDQWQAWPTQGNVFSIAKEWSLDPSQLHSSNLPPSTGFIAGWE